MSSFASSWAFRVALRSVSGAAALVPAVVAASWLSSNISNKDSSIVSCSSNKGNDNDNNNPEAATTSYSTSQRSSVTSCSNDDSLEHQSTSRRKAGMVGGNDEEHGSFMGLFPKRQLWKPAVPYPLWDDDWDDRKPISLGDKELDRQRDRDIRNRGITRHIILIRHGQYDETHKEDDSKQVLTELGREQAELTGKRLAEIVKGVNESFGPCNVKYLRVSNLTRAKQTAEIIAKYLPGIPMTEPDANLNEGRPAHNIPGGTARPSVIQKTDECHPRIETAFQTYFYRAAPPREKGWKLLDESPTLDEHHIETPTTTTAIASTLTPTSESCNPQEEGSPHVMETMAPSVEDDHEREQHEFEIIVGHANVIRYFFCRALQLPPEAWLRLCIFNCSLTYFTIRPTGTVSCRLLGDIGHLGYDHSTFSMHHGFNW